MRTDFSYIPLGRACGAKGSTNTGIVFVTLLLCTASARAQQPPPVERISLNQAIQLALAHSHSLKAARTQIRQSQAQEITARLRPNPVLTGDYNFIPIFSPSVFSLPESQNPLPQEFDVGVSYLIERGGKRPARIQAARDQTGVVQSQVADSERTLTANVAQQFIAALLARSTLEFARQDLTSFEQTVHLSEIRKQAGDISQGDLLKIKLQLLQFQMDVSSAQINHLQALGSLRQLLGYESVPERYDVLGELAYTPVQGGKEELQAIALEHRPDLAAAIKGVAAAQSQYQLAKADAKRDMTVSWTYSHVAGVHSADVGANIEIPLFTRNQGEIARTRYAIDQSQETRTATQETAVTDVSNAYEALKTNGQIAELYQQGYLAQSEESMQISEFAYNHGAGSVLDLLDAQRSYRSVQINYRQALANYMLSLEQVRQVVGTRSLP